LNKGKLQSIKDIDVKITVLKNSMSTFVYNNLKELIVLGNLGFTTKYYKQFNNTDITNWETQKLFNMVCIMYLNSIEKRYKNIKFEVQNKIITTYFKKNTKNHKKNDVKEYTIYKKKSTLSSLLKYLMYVMDL
jgi:hypothetical protein